MKIQTEIEAKPRKKPKQVAGYNYRIRANQYVRSNDCYSVDNKTAHSYGWWCYVREYKGITIFNNYTYSNSTSRHQSNMRFLLDALGIRIDLEVRTVASLDAQGKWINAAIRSMEQEIKELRDLIAKPRTHRTKNLGRLKRVDSIKREIIELKLLKGVLNED